MTATASRTVAPISRFVDRLIGPRPSPAVGEVPVAEQQAVEDRAEERRAGDELEQRDRLALARRAGERHQRRESGRHRQQAGDPRGRTHPGQHERRPRHRQHGGEPRQPDRPQAGVAAGLEAHVRRPPGHDREDGDHDAGEGEETRASPRSTAG
jgi:hypothetical protein